MNKSDPMAAYKERMLGLHSGGDLDTFKFFENYPAEKKTNEKLLGALRFVEYDGDLNLLGECFTPTIESVKMCKCARRKFRMPAISIENEKKMLNRLKKIAETNLKVYPQTYEEDAKIMQNEKSLTFNQRNCIIFRMGEKKVSFTYNNRPL